LYEGQSEEEFAIRKKEKVDENNVK